MRGMLRVRRVIGVVSFTVPGIAAVALVLGARVIVVLFHLGFLDSRVAVPVVSSRNNCWSRLETKKLDVSIINLLHETSGLPH